MDIHGRGVLAIGVGCGHGALFQAELAEDREAKQGMGEFGGREAAGLRLGSATISGGPVCRRTGAQCAV